MNYSWQRQLILETIRNTPQLMTAAQIYNLTRKSCPHLSLGTVYRNLNQLVEAGSLRRVSVPGEADRFDRDPEARQHLYCVRCRRVVRMDLRPGALHELALSCPGIRVEDEDLIVTGLCGDCARREKG